MNDKSDRKWRLEQLLHKQKSKQKIDYGELFNECVEALGEETVILSQKTSAEVMNQMVSIYPIAWWGRIDWDKVVKKYEVAQVTDILPTLKSMNMDIEIPTYIIWDGDFPVLQTELSKVINAIEHVIAVGFDTFILCPSQYVIEFYHEGEITIGFTP